MKNIFLTIMMFLTYTITLGQSFYDIEIQSISGEMITMNEFKGKYVLVVNVASKCGYTKQYADLEELYQSYENLVVLGVPCNQFANQEPESEKEILQFCSSKYNVTFPMTSKVKVKGKDKHPLYQWLTQKDYNKKDDYKINWNFNKFIVDPDGELVDHFKSGVKPLSDDITSVLEK
jgi:glutathione peroxidase